MTFEELKAEAEKQGYSLIKKQTYIKLLPCTCGAKRIAVWSKIGGGWFCKCMKCGKESEEALKQREARINWNNMILNKEDKK